MKHLVHIQAGLIASILASCAAPASSLREVSPVATPHVPPPSATVERENPARLEPEAETPAVALGQEAATATADDEWRFVLAPYAWLLSVDGSATINGQESKVDEDFGDILDQLNLVLEGRFEAWKGRWGFLADLTYAELENDIEIGPLEGDTSTDLVLAFLGAQYRFVEQEYADAPRGVTVDGLAGIAYTSIDGELDFDNGPKVDGDESWTDPIIGLRSRVSLSEKWGASLESIIGGFELFDGSDLVTMSTVLVGRTFGESSHLYFGWRTLDIDYEDSDFEMNVNINGPIVGYEWSF